MTGLAVEEWPFEELDASLATVPAAGAAGLPVTVSDDMEVRVPEDGREANAELFEVTKAAGEVTGDGTSTGIETSGCDGTLGALGGLRFVEVEASVCAFEFTVVCNEVELLQPISRSAG